MSENKQIRRLVAFDVCDTLYDANTTLDFIDYYHRRQNNRRIGRTVHRWRSRTSPFFYLGAAAYLLFGLDIARQRIIASLAGESREALAAAAREYVREALSARANHVLHERLESHRAAGDHILLLSSSIDLVIGPIASQLGVDHRASALDFTGETCTGRLAVDLTGAKGPAIGGLREAGTELWVYTDNRSDADIIGLADRAFIVIPKGKSDNGWEEAAVTSSGSKAASFLPFGYLAVSRLNGARDLAYHVATSWLPAIWLVIRLTDLGPVAAAAHFLIGYLAFIAVYEIGYFANDAWDARRSSGGRDRLRFPVDAPYLALFLLIRLGAWTLVAVAMNWIANPLWLAGYAALAVALVQHNLVSSRGFRLASFYELATLRFLLPIAGLLSVEAMVPALLVALLIYAFPRFLSYMESKDLLMLEERRAPAFGFFLLLSFAPLILYLGWMMRMGVLVELLAYFLAIHTAWWLLTSAREVRLQSKG